MLPLLGLNVPDVVSTFHCIKHVTCNEGGLTSQPGQGRTQAVNVLAEPALVAGSWSPQPEWSGPACNTNLQSNLCRIQSQPTSQTQTPIPPSVDLSPAPTITTEERESKVQRASVIILIKVQLYFTPFSFVGIIRQSPPAGRT